MQDQNAFMDTRLLFRYRYRNKYFMEKEQEIAGEREEVREKWVRRIAEWKAVLTVDCLFGNENEHPETGNLRFEMSPFEERGVNDLRVTSNSEGQQVQRYCFILGSRSFVTTVVRRRVQKITGY